MSNRLHVQRMKFKKKTIPKSIPTRSKKGNLSVQVMRLMKVYYPKRVHNNLELIQNVRDVTYALSIQFGNFLSNYNSQARILKPT